MIQTLCVYVSKHHDLLLLKDRSVAAASDAFLFYLTETKTDKLETSSGAVCWQDEH